MSVVLRCPSCGTTQPAPGECEACNEAQVRPYCPNHEPGLWLDGLTCPSCEARRAADTARADAAREESARADAARADAARADAARADAARREAARAASAAVRSRPPASSHGPVFTAPPEPDPFGVLVRTRRPEMSLEPELSPVAQLGGCAMRLVIIALVLCGALVAALYFFGRFFL